MFDNFIFMLRNNKLNTLKKKFLQKQKKSCYFENKVNVKY